MSNWTLINVLTQHRQYFNYWSTIINLGHGHFLRCRRPAVSVMNRCFTSACQSVYRLPIFLLTLYLNGARSAYSTWLNRGNHATRPAYISVRVLRGRTYRMPVAQLCYGAIMNYGIDIAVRPDRLKVRDMKMQFLLKLVVWPLKRSLFN